MAKDNIKVTIDCKGCEDCERQIIDGTSLEL